MSSACMGLVQNIFIDCGTAIRDHMPLCIELNCTAATVHNVSSNAVCARPLWDHATACDIDSYAAVSDTLLGNLNIPSELITCNNMHCTSHRPAIETLYTEVSWCLLKASEMTIPYTRERTRHNEHHIPGWNDMVKAKYEYSRTLFQIWIGENKPRFGYLWDEYRRAKLQFKYALRQCRRQESMHRSNSLALPLMDGNVNRFLVPYKEDENKA